ncbi:TPA: hypothetical protein ACSW15_005018 [Enterobacter hormaechei]|uniref:hypothetical protein n=1 Tax=Enterobacter cloacae complex TaxID=354276 RepID=UPI0006499AE4|nr:hypothetical protein [Enterobacter hormaechei]EJB8197410.1 hypothetical protein [Enterobacter hormaechei]EKU5343704.1 hypothetical protein [Enterobacter hormaechei]EKU5348522.1 hypothetical protein [Enterobacter hormaechei]EKU5425039.1 hypothetical protein [Enterobacter hormaechei]EKX8243777.1 hypothetical protein [Enterobacter hormaechei]
MKDFDLVERKLMNALALRGMHTSSLILNQLAEHYAPEFQSASQEEQQEMLCTFTNYQSRRGFNIKFDWAECLSK